MRRAVPRRAPRAAPRARPSRTRRRTPLRRGHDRRRPRARPGWDAERGDVIAVGTAPDGRLAQRRQPELAVEALRQLEQLAEELRSSGGTNVSCSTLVVAPGTLGRTAANAAAIRSPSSRVEKRTSKCATAEAGTVFAAVPAEMRLGVTVVPEEGSASSASSSTCRATSRAALIPRSGFRPACAARPRASRR